MSATSNYVTVLERELHYMEWGRDNARTVIMWHGLARTGRDFDDIAASLARRYGWSLTVGRSVKDIEEWPDRIAKVSLDDVLRVAQKYLDPRSSVTGTLMPGEPAPEPAVAVKPATPNRS